MKDFPKKITVIYNSVDESSPIIAPDQREADQDTIMMAEDIAAHLAKDFKVDLLEIPFKNPGLAGTLKTDLVFNLCEGVGYNYACQVIEAMDNAGIPYAGAGIVNYHIGSDKALLKEYLNRMNILTPSGQFFSEPEAKVDPRLKFPLIVKPELEHGSVGITQESVVRNGEELEKRLKYVFDTYQEGAIAEEYIEGRELQLIFVGNGESLMMLPVKEILFVNGMASKWHVVTFAAKWQEESAEYLGTPTICPAPNISFAETEFFEKFGRNIFYETQCQDYTRIDIRYLKDKKRAYVLDVNPNPDLSSDSAMTKAAVAYGWDYRRLLGEIVRAAWKRVVYGGRRKVSRKTSRKVLDNYEQIGKFAQ